LTRAAAGRLIRRLTGYTNAQRAIRDDRWKLIAYPQINKMQLFDLQKDPDEMNDLAGDAGHASEIERLTTLLREHQTKAGDVQPLTTDRPQSAEPSFNK